MFDEEVEERFVKSYPEFCCNGKPLSPYWDLWEAGTEYGYNKVNEWHFVKDKDYPKDNKPVLCILGDINSDNCEVGYYNNVGSGEPWHLETYHLPDDDGDNVWGVSAWKEIVLPKESV